LEEALGASAIYDNIILYDLPTTGAEAPLETKAGRRLGKKSICYEKNISINNHNPVNNNEYECTEFKRK